MAGYSGVMAHTYQFESQTVGEEIANSIIHGVGAALGMAGTAVLIVSAALDGSAIRVVSFSIFGFSLILLYLASTLYHGLPHSAAKRVFHVIDHSAIYLLIAGTYTPVTLAALGGGWGWTLFGVTWGFAAIGMAATACFFEKARYFNLTLYIAMGWLIVITGPRLLLAMSTTALFWLIAGGVLYTAGVYFYRSIKKFHHACWHLFVLAGSLCHFFMMFCI